MQEKNNYDDAPLQHPDNINIKQWREIYKIALHDEAPCHRCSFQEFCSDEGGWTRKFKCFASKGYKYFRD